MASFEIELTRTAERQLKRLPKRDVAAVVEKLEALAGNPFPHGIRKLAGHDDVYRLRVGRYRVLYAVETAKLVVLVLKIGHRKDVYRGA